VIAHGNVIERCGAVGDEAREYVDAAS